MHCYTIGHSNQGTDAFLKLLDRHHIDCVVDIRTSPYSKYVSHFNKDNIARDVKHRQMQYIFMGDKLGGKYTDPLVLKSDGTVDYNKVRQLSSFKEGISFVIQAIRKGLTVALMCAEKDPQHCHRFNLVSNTLINQSVQVQHILNDGSCVSHQDLIHQMEDGESSNPDQLLFWKS